MIKIKPIKIPAGRICDQADAIPGVMTYDSEVKRVHYVAGSGEILILKNDGFLRVKAEDALRMLPEIKNAAEDALSLMR